MSDVDYRHVACRLQPSFQSGEPVATVLEDGGELVGGGGSQHGYARLAEVGYALEYGSRGKMPSRMEYAPVFVDAFHVDAELFLEDVNLAVECEREVLRTSSRRSRISLNIHGRPNVARPTITASTP